MSENYHDWNSTLSDILGEDAVVEITRCKTRMESGAEPHDCEWALDMGDCTLRDLANGAKTTAVIKLQQWVRKPTKNRVVECVESTPFSLADLLRGRVKKTRVEKARAILSQMSEAEKAALLESLR